MRSTLKKAKVKATLLWAVICLPIAYAVGLFAGIILEQPLSLIVSLAIGLVIGHFGFIALRKRLNEIEHDYEIAQMQSLRDEIRAFEEEMAQDLNTSDDSIEKDERQD